jgi:hypothetical protein
MNVSIHLEDWEWDMVDAEADACGITREQLLREMIAEEAALVLDSGMEKIFLQRRPVTRPVIN